MQMQPHANAKEEADHLAITGNWGAREVPNCALPFKSQLMDRYAKWIF
jgi:hypothetical protein